jgi:hypothetical protein
LQQHLFGLGIKTVANPAPHHGIHKKTALHARHPPLHHTAKPHPLSRLSTSSGGLDFIFRHEAQNGVTNHLHWPGGSSGVTLGPGYDMKERSATQIIHDMTAIGLDGVVAAKIATAHGLTDSAADDFADDNEDLVDLKHAQEMALLKLIVPHYEKIVIRNVHVDQKQNEFDALVSFCYNPGGSFVPIAHRIDLKKIGEAMDVIRTRVITGKSRSSGLANRRRDEVNLYLNAQYTKPSQTKSGTKSTN